MKTDPPEPADESEASTRGPGAQGAGTGAEPDSGSSSETKPAPVQVESIVYGELLGRLSERSVSSRHYKVQGEVAKGGMGAILRVWDEDLRRHLAMKVVLERKAADGSDDGTVDERMLGRFVEEAQVTGQLEHPGIVPVHEVGVDDNGRMYFTMQLVRGRDLEKILKVVHAGDDDEWNKTRALHVLLKVCDAMSYAHSKSVIHRDLKPANIMVGGFGEVYVMDWGLARVIGHEPQSDIRLRSGEDHPSSAEVHTNREDARETGLDSPLMTMDGDVMGTPAYMSPEQAFGNLAAMGPASDIYSIGSILYHVLAEHAPYGSPGKKARAFDTLKRLQKGPPEPIEERAPDAAPELVAICEKAMAREIPERYASMQDFARDLRAFLDGRVVAAYEAGAVAEFRKWVQRNRALATTAASAGSIILVGLTVASLVLAGKNEELSDMTDQALDSAALAEERAAKVLRLSDVTRLRELRAEAAELWPAYPERTRALSDWIGRARELLEREELHRTELSRLTDGETTEDVWQRETLTALTDGLADLRDPEHGLLADVEARLAFAQTVERRTVTGSAAAAAWAEARQSIADVDECPAYDGLRIEPQVGLVPIGPDPHSRLWEFAHLQTGAAAERDPATGGLDLTDETGLVFVLLPGGAFTMGSQVEDRTAPGYSADARDNELPRIEVTLQPFFLSKYEMTQGQWLRFTGRNPSTHTPGKTFRGKRIGLTNPVEMVTWFDADEVLGHLGLALPTEAQWEYAARAGTSTPWWTGLGRESLRGANLADLDARDGESRSPFTEDWPGYRDGYVAHAPVDTWVANPFGLHHVHGNVFEWCRDHHAADLSVGTRGPDGELDTAPTGFRTLRGGSYYHAARACRSANRTPTEPDRTSGQVGVRPARRLETDR